MDIKNIFENIPPLKCLMVDTLPQISEMETDIIYLVCRELKNEDGVTQGYEYKQYIRIDDDAVLLNIIENLCDTPTD